MIIWGTITCWLLINVLLVAVLLLAARHDRLSGVGCGRRRRCAHAGTAERCRACPLRSAAL